MFIGEICGTTLSPAWWSQRAQMGCGQSMGRLAISQMQMVIKAAAQRAAVLGCEGKWAIHPSQVALANEVMSPSEADVTKAQRIIEAMKQAAAEGKGAVSLDGRLIDYASIRQAEVLVEKAAQIAAG